MKEAFIDIRKQLEKKLKKDRFEHTIGVMYTLLKNPPLLFPINQI